MKITHEATDRSPEVNFDLAANEYLLKGESYPEDINSFYGDMMNRLESHFGELEGAEISFRFELIYFNSSTAKILMGLIDLLEETAERGNKVSIEWLYEEGDDNMEEIGEEYAEDLEHASFTLKEVAVD